MTSKLTARDIADLMYKHGVSPQALADAQQPEVAADVETSLNAGARFEVALLGRRCELTVWDHDGDGEGVSVYLTREQAREFFQQCLDGLK